MQNEVEFESYARRVIQGTMTVTGIFVILWALLPSLRPEFAGLSLGAAVSMYFAYSLKKQSELAADVALLSRRKKPNVVMVYRVVMVLAAVLLAKELEPKIGYVSLPWMLVGLFVYQLVILGGFLYKKITKH